MTSRIDLIKDRITQALAPVTLELIDESQAHAGHAGAIESGGGHFSALIVANAFDGKNLVQRHQLVYRALGDLMQTEIHAFSMKVYSPEEFQGK
jgi:BolA family transcriptional regulator, general stress-responsive regulator